jgi:glycosyltransferase involved in cell wall biosynthesis
MQDIVSFTIPTLNEEKNVVKTMESIINQSIVKANPGDFEIVLVDSDSTDRTVELGEVYADLVIFAPKGLLTARALATDLAAGGIIMNINSDTYYPPDYADLMLSHFSDPEVVAVAGGWNYGNWLDLGTKFFVDTHVRPWLPGMASAFRKSAYQTIGGFDLSIDQTDYAKVVWAEENDFAQRMSKVGKIVYEPRAVAVASSRRILDGETRSSLGSF